MHKSLNLEKRLKHIERISNLNDYNKADSQIALNNLDIVKNAIITNNTSETGLSLMLDKLTETLHMSNSSFIEATLYSVAGDVAYDLFKETKNDDYLQTSYDYSKTSADLYNESATLKGVYELAFASERAFEFFELDEKNREDTLDLAIDNEKKVVETCNSLIERDSKCLKINKLKYNALSDLQEFSLAKIKRNDINSKLDLNLVNVVMGYNMNLFDLAIDKKKFGVAYFSISKNAELARKSFRKMYNLAKNPDINESRMTVIEDWYKYELKKARFLDEHIEDVANFRNPKSRLENSYITSFNSAAEACFYGYQISKDNKWIYRGLSSLDANENSTKNMSKNNFIYRSIWNLKLETLLENQNYFNAYAKIDDTLELISGSSISDFSKSSAETISEKKNKNQFLKLATIIYDVAFKGAKSNVECELEVANELMNFYVDNLSYIKPKKNLARSAQSKLKYINKKINEIRS